ncbi:hypothetical protein LEP1GSC039_3289 [Leptospira santarosai str. 2000027870]|nr:hypothetical protein LEP1GSC039_3289 [Leptospira santarosai str. 2000027870]
MRLQLAVAIQKRNRQSIRFETPPNQITYSRPRKITIRTVSDLIPKRIVNFLKL